MNEIMSREFTLVCELFEGRESLDPSTLFPWVPPRMSKPGIV